MLRREIEEKYGQDWWKRRLKIDDTHVLKLIARGIDEKIPTILKCGVIYPHPKKPNRYTCVHKEPDGEHISIIFVPTKHSNIVITGFPSKPEEIEMFERIRGEAND